MRSIPCYNDEWRSEIAFCIKSKNYSARARLCIEYSKRKALFTIPYCFNSKERSVRNWY